MAIKFLRRGTTRYSKLGLRRKNKQKWKKPTGRDNKLREKRRGYGRFVSIGYGTSKDKTLVVVNNLKELAAVQKGATIVVGKIGMKKKLELLKKAKEMKIEIWKTNVEKFVKKNTKAPKKKVDTKKDKKEKKKDDKKTEKKEDTKKEVKKPEEANESKK